MNILLKLLLLTLLIVQIKGACNACEKNNSPIYQGDVNLCGVCDDHKVFACLNETTIAFCFGDNVPNITALSYCPDNTVCNINNEKYCSDSSTVEPSCTTIIVSTTTEDGTTTEITTESSSGTTAAPRDPNTICKDAGSPGSYPTDDATCAKFVVCYTMNGVLRGLLKTCPSGQYFHPERKICTKDKPNECV